jgi:hypothetical protein
MILCHHTVGGGGGGGSGGGHCHGGHGKGQGGWTGSSNQTSTGGERTLSGAEKAAAQSALAKLAGTGSAQFLTSDHSAGATQLQISKTLSNGLISGHGADSFAGGAVGGRAVLPTFASDSVGGGAMAKSAAASELYTGFRAGSESVHLAGATAMGVRSEPSVSMSHAAVMSDHTILNLSGVHANSLVKPGSH